MKQTINPIRPTLQAALLIYALLLSSCALFVSAYDQRAFEQFTELKAFHFKLLDDFTEGSGKTWDASRLAKTADAGELKFRETTEYAQSRHDQTRINAVDILHNRFGAHCHIIERSHTLSKVFAANLKEEVGKNYDLAIKGEKVRYRAPESH